MIGLCGELDILFAVNDPRHAPTDQHSDRNVNDGVLFEKHGGNTDQKCNDIKKASPAPAAEQVSVAGGIEYGHGTYHVKRRADIGIGVSAVERGHALGKQVIPGKGRGAKELDCGVEKEKEQANGVGQDDKQHQSLEGALVVKKGIDVDTDQIDEPKQIGNEKKLAKGDEIVQGTVHHMVSGGPKELFGKIERGTVQGPIGQKPETPLRFGTERAQYIFHGDSPWCILKASVGPILRRKKEEYKRLLGKFIIRS